MVGLSLLTLVPGLVGGSETYVRQLTRALAQHGKHEYLAFVPTIAQGAAGGLPEQVIKTYPAGRTMPTRMWAMARAGLAPDAIRREMGLDRIAAMHFPLSTMLPPVDSPRAATTVLDVQHEFFPDFFSPPELAYRRVVYGWTVRRSRIVITISEHARQTVIERMRAPADRVRVIHLGLDHALFRPLDVEREDFLLYPANRWRHKNHERLFTAFQQVRRGHRSLRLVLTGNGHRGHPTPPGVEVLGNVTQHELLGLYGRARMLVFPSLFEGFGQPPLEAMACGCPVAVSRTASLPEVCGEGAVYFDPTSVEDMVAAMERVLSEPDRLVANGLQNAARFSWRHCADQHDEVYSELIGG